MLGKKRGSVLGMMLHDWSAKGWRAGLGVGKSGRISGFQEQGLSPRGVGTAWEMLSQAPPGTASHKRARKGSLAGTEQILQQAKWMQMELKQRENLNLHVLPRPGLEQLLGLVRQENTNYLYEDKQVLLSGIFTALVRFLEQQIVPIFQIVVRKNSKPF